MRVIQSKNFLLQDIPDLIPPATRWYRRPEVLAVEFARAGGMIDTLEGQVSYSAGDALITGISGERWPVPKNGFDQIYQQMDENSPPGLDGLYRRRPLPVLATQMREPFTVEIGNGQNLFGQVGDWLVQNESGAYSVVAANRFSELYQASNPAK